MCLRACVSVCALLLNLCYICMVDAMCARVGVRMCRGGGVCSAQHFAVLLLACYPSTMNEVQRNDRSRSFFLSVLQVDSHCLPVQVDIRALHFSSIH